MDKIDEFMKGLTIEELNRLLRISDDIKSFISDLCNKHDKKEIDSSKVLEQESCEDCISRQAAIDAIDNYIGTFDAIDVNFLDGLKTAKKLMMQLPSAQSYLEKDENIPMKYFKNGGI